MPIPRRAFLLVFACACSGTAKESAPKAASVPASSTAESGWRALLVLTPPPGWTVAEEANEKDYVRRVLTSGSCRVETDVWAGQPPSPGGPMAAQSTRRVIVDGRKLELTKTSQFEGKRAVVDALFAKDGTSYARLVFRDCANDVEDKVLASVRLAKEVRDD